MAEAPYAKYIRISAFHDSSQLSLSLNTSKTSNLVFDAMPTLRFLVFKRILFPKSLAHWAFFIPDREGSAQGILFEVRRMNSNKTHFWHRTFNYLEHSSRLRANIPIPEINIESPGLNRACHMVNKNRPFHLLTSNCQHWVFEVIEFLIGDMGIRNGVEILRRIERAGYKPLGGYRYRISQGDENR